MATIKSFTDLSQSKILSKILSHESADMCYKCIGEDPYDICLRLYSEWREEYKGLLVNKEVDAVPCWSLATLFEVLRPHFERLEIHLRADKNYSIFAVSGDFVFRSFDERPEGYNNIVDACYEMI